MLSVCLIPLESDWRVILIIRHRKGGPLAVTDANLILGRLVPQYFPKIFGKNADEPLDAEASMKKFEELSKEINGTYDKKLSLDEIVYGCIHTFSSPYALELT